MQLTTGSVLCPLRLAQGAQLMSQYGINVPPGMPVDKVEEVGPAARKLADEEGLVVLKAQILAGGRGLGTFTNGLKGGVHVVKVRLCKCLQRGSCFASSVSFVPFPGAPIIASLQAEEATALAKRMLGGTLVTKQTGPKGKPVNTLYVAHKMKFTREMYFAILLDRKTAGPMLIG